VRRGCPHLVKPHVLRRVVVDLRAVVVKTRQERDDRARERIAGDVQRRLLVPRIPTGRNRVDGEERRARAGEAAVDAVEDPAAHPRARARERLARALLLRRQHRRRVVQVQVHRDAAREPEIPPPSVVLPPALRARVERDQQVREHGLDALLPIAERHACRDDGMLHQPVVHLRPARNKTSRDGAH
jgi:hypothetical protein